MESVTQEKKKLRSVISFEAKAPPGYTFIPAGNPKFTNACKEVCRKDGLKVFTVSTTPHQRTHNLSQQVHRIGYHFPSVVVATICMERGLFLSSTGKVMPYRQLPSQGSAHQLMRGRRADSEVSQNTINVEARDAIKDLFPNIPEKDLKQIIKTAFQKGKRKVGTAVELPLARRAQLAVVAHIRHIYTNYDRLLRITSFQDARKAVEEPCLAKLVQWRGDDESGETVLEDVFREVIVISDDEDDENDSEDSALAHGRDSSIEFVSSNAVVKELQTVPVEYGETSTANRIPLRGPSEDEAPPGFRFVTESSRKRAALPGKKIDRRGFSRYQAWDRARDRYRDAQNAPNSNQLVRPVVEPYHTVSNQEPFAGPPPASYPSYTGKLPGHAGRVNFGSFLRNNHDSPTVPEPGPRSDMKPAPPKIIRLADGSVFERAEAVTNNRYEMPSDHRSLRPVAPAHTRGHTPGHIREYIPSEKVKYQDPRPWPYSSGNPVVSDEPERNVLPSIEEPFSSGQTRKDAMDPAIPATRKRDLGWETYPKQSHLGDLPGRVDVIHISDDRYPLPSKRNKVAHDNKALPLSSESRRNADRAFYVASSSESPGKPQPYPLNGLRPEPLPNRIISLANENHSQALRKYPEPASPQSGRIVARDPQLSGLVMNGQPIAKRGQPSEGPPLNHTSRPIHPGGDFLRQPSSFSTIRSVPRSQDNEDPRGFNTFTRSDQRQRILTSRETHDPALYLSRPDPGNSIIVEQAPLERRPLLSHSDTRPSSIYSHDFVRPVQVRKELEASRYHNPQNPLTKSGSNLRNVTSHSSANRPQDGRTMNRSITPPFQHPASRTIVSNSRSDPYRFSHYPDPFLNRPQIGHSGNPLGFPSGFPR